MAGSPFRRALHGLLAAEFTRGRRRPCLAIGLGVTAAVWSGMQSLVFRNSPGYASE